MNNHPSAANTQIPLGTMSDKAAYSARIQEAMRYDKLRSSDYPIVMTIMHAVSQGFTEEQWEKEQQRTVSILTKQASDKKTSHADAANRYEQTIACFKDLLLWPW
jgi:transcriptional regulator with AAA-type ATPase domain